MRRNLAIAAIVIALGLLAAWAVPESKGLTAITWSYSFDESNSVISLEGDIYAEHGVFKNGSNVIVNTVGNVPINIYNVRGDLIVTNATTPYTNTFGGLVGGHYAIECEGDRFSFWVKPADYTTNSLIGVHTTGSGMPSFPQHTDLNRSMEPMYERMGNLEWDEIETSSNVYNFAALDSQYVAYLTNDTYKIPKIIFGAFIHWGVPYWYAGLEKRTLTITNGAATSGNVTIVLDGSSTNVAVSASGDASQTAYEISTNSFANLSGTDKGWDVTRSTSNLVFLSKISNDRNGAYTISGQSVSGTYAQNNQGVNWATWDQVVTNLVIGVTNFWQAAYDHYGADVFYGLEAMNEFKISLSSHWPQFEYPTIADWPSRTNYATAFYLINKATKQWIDDNALDWKVVGFSLQGLRGNNGIPDTELIYPDSTNSVDYWSWHHYPQLEDPPDAWGPTATQKPQEDMVATWGKTGVPVFFGELGVHGQSWLGLSNPTSGTVDQWSKGVTAPMGVNRAIKTMAIYKKITHPNNPVIVGHNLGVARYTPDGSPSDVYGWEGGGQLGVNRTRGPHPKTSALLMAGHKLKDSVYISSVSDTNQVLRKYTFQKPNGSQFTIAWTTEGNTTNIPMAELGNTAEDVWGNNINYSGTLTEEPVFFFMATTLYPATTEF